MFPHKLRLWLAVLLFILAVVIIVVSLLPGPRIQQVLPVPPVILPTPTSGAWIEPFWAVGRILAGGLLSPGSS